jgi:hypothetical protein
MADWGKLGGTNPMHGPRGTAQQKPGVSLGSDIKVKPGGSGEGFYSSGATNKDYAGTQKPGVSAATKAGGNAKFAEGGTHAMFGNRGSLPAKGGSSAP